MFGMWQWEQGGKPHVHNKMCENSCTPQEKKSTATSVPHIIIEIPQSATGFKTRTEREKQHLLASYYDQPVLEFVLPLQCW